MTLGELKQWAKDNEVSDEADVTVCMPSGDYVAIEEEHLDPVVTGGKVVEIVINT